MQESTWGGSKVRRQSRPTSCASAASSGAENRVREALGVPIYNTSGVRCQGHNRAVGGVENSLHLIGKAVDFYAPGKSAGELLAIAKAQPEIVYAYAIDGSAVHMNVAR